MASVNEGQSLNFGGVGTPFFPQYDFARLSIPVNGNNAAEGENNFKYANSYPMNWAVKNWFAQDIFESLLGLVILGALWEWKDIACKCPFLHHAEFELNTRFASSNLTLK